MHIYREMWNDSWAESLPTGVFRDIEKFWVTIEDFLRYCNIGGEMPMDRELL